MTLLDGNGPTPAQHLAAVAAEVAASAAALVRGFVGHAALAGTKSSPTDVVTDTDLQSETLIREQLLARCPGSTIFGEELTDDLGTNSVGWVVDPIDGTVNFLYDLPVVSVSIAATINGVTVAGAVCDVVRGEVFSAALRSGATRDGRAISCAATGTLDQSLVGTGFAYDSARRGEQALTIGRLLPLARDIRCMGSAALNLCWVACGRLDAYFEQSTKPYDYAAGALIAAEAGATVELPAANDFDLTIAARPAVFDALHHVVTRTS